MDGAHSLRNHPAGGFVAVHMVFPQNRDHRNVGEVEGEGLLCHRGHHMHVEVEGNLLCVDVEESVARSRRDHSNPVERFAESAHDNAVEGYIHVEDHVYRIRRPEGILGVGGNGIDMGHDTGLAPRPVVPKIDEKLQKKVLQKDNQHTSATQVM
jgi:hypothetical protein